MNGLGETHSCSCIRIMNSSTENDSCHSLPQNPCKKASTAGEQLQSQDNTHLGYNSILSVRNDEVSVLGVGCKTKNMFFDGILSLKHTKISKFSYLLLGTWRRKRLPMTTSRSYSKTALPSETSITIRGQTKTKRVHRMVLRCDS